MPSVRLGSRVSRPRLEAREFHVERNIYDRIVEQQFRRMVFPAKQLAKRSALGLRASGRHTAPLANPVLPDAH